MVVVITVLKSDPLVWKVNTDQNEFTCTRQSSSDDDVDDEDYKVELQYWNLELLIYIRVSLFILDFLRYSLLFLLDILRLNSTTSIFYNSNQQPTYIRQFIFQKRNKTKEKDKDISFS